MAFRTASKVCQQASSTIPSFGFSGAGFLACYHLGASKCFLEHGYLNFDLASNSNEIGYRYDTRPILTGVSGGAIVAAALAAGVNPDDGMVTVLAIAARTQQEGVLDALQPG